MPTGEIPPSFLSSEPRYGLVICPADRHPVRHLPDAKMHSSEPITYIVSITPGTVLAVKAYKQFTGERRLVVVPDNLYRVETKDYGAVTAVQIVFDKPLSTVTDQGWSDDIYVTFQSSVGPDTINILKYLITNYTDLTWDDTSFNHVQTKLTPFPANFPILDRKNTLQVLQEIAYQARCALWLSNGVFYIKYLPEEPDADDDITVSDLDADSGVEVELTSTENLVTKLKVTWRLSWAPRPTDREKDKSEKTMILRHNISRYGTQEEEYEWYIYNHLLLGRNGSVTLAGKHPWAVGHRSLNKSHHSLSIHTTRGQRPSVLRANRPGSWRAEGQRAGRFT